MSFLFYKALFLKYFNAAAPEALESNQVPFSGVVVMMLNTLGLLTVCLLECFGYVLIIAELQSFGIISYVIGVLAVIDIFSALLLTVSNGATTVKMFMVSIGAATCEKDPITGKLKIKIKGEGL